MKREFIVGVIVLSLLGLTIILEALIPTQTTILDPLKEIIGKILHSPFKTSWLWKSLVYSEQKSLTEMKGKPLKLTLVVKGCAVEISEPESGIAYELKVYTSKWSTNWDVKTSLKKNDEFNELFIYASGALVSLKVNPYILKAVNITGNGVSFKISLSNLNKTSFSIEAIGATVSFDLHYNNALVTNLLIKTKGAVINGNIQVPKKTPIYAKATSYNSIIKVEIFTEKTETIKIFMGEKSIGKTGGLSILIHSESSTVNVDAKW